MWKNYSAGYFKNNRTMMIFIMTVALFTGALISFISHYYYNLWQDYAYRSYLKTGSQEMPISTAFVIYSVIIVLTVISLTLMILLPLFYEFLSSKRIFGYHYLTLSPAPTHHRNTPPLLPGWYSMVEGLSLGEKTSIIPDSS